MSLLARDQAIRSLITTSDERFQAIAMRTARLRGQPGRPGRVRAPHPRGDGGRGRLDPGDRPVPHAARGRDGAHPARAGRGAPRRDASRTSTSATARSPSSSSGRCSEHGELIANETARIVESMQSYVQGGAEAIGRLAQRIEEHAKLFVLQDHNITQHVIDAVGRHGRGRDGPARADQGEGRAARPRPGAAAGRDRAHDRRADARHGRAGPLGLDGPAEAGRGAAWPPRRSWWARTARSRSTRPSLTRTIDQRMGALAQVVEERMDLARAHDRPSRCSRCPTRRPPRWTATSSG